MLTTGPGHARTLAEDAARRGFDIVLSIGGDGTANEVAAGLVGTKTVLGLVPMGSGNGLARVLRIPLRPDRALRALEDAVPAPMDVGFVNDRIFLNVAGIGFDAIVGDTSTDTEAEAADGMSPPTSGSAPSARSRTARSP